jgi:hypothetical protein
MDVEDAVIADGDPVGISAEVLQDTLNPIEGRLAIDDPLFTIELAPESFKILRRREMVYPVGESKGTRFEAFSKKIKELPFE